MDWLLDDVENEDREQAGEGLEPGAGREDPLAAVEVRALELAGWAVTGLLAAVLRLGALGLRPLGEGEAEQALAAFRFSQGSLEAAPGGTLPALFTGNIATFTLLGANDWTARLWPAVAGVVLVLLPWVLRNRLGRIGALVAALLLAISPTAVWSARGLDGATLAAACGLALVAGLVRAMDGHRRAGLFLAAAGLGLGLAAGPSFYSLVLALILYGLGLFLAGRLLSRDWGWQTLVAAAGDAWREEPALVRRATITAGAVLGLAVTAFALHPAGVGHAADLLGAWVRGLLPTAEDPPALTMLLLLLRYELLILLPVVALAIVGIRRRPAPGAAGDEPIENPPAPGATLPLDGFLVAWAAVALVLSMVAGHRTPGDLLLALVPLALLAGQAIERSWRWLRERVFWGEAWLIAGVSLGIGVFLYLQLAFTARGAGAATVSVAGVTLYATTTYLILAAVALLLLVALGAVAWYWRGKELLAAGAWLTALAVLGLITVKGMWGPAFGRATDPRELLLAPGGATSPQVRLLAAELQELSLAVQGDAHTLPVTVDAGTGPVVAWYLRHWPVTTVEALSAPPDTVAAVTLAEDRPAIGEAFSGQSFELKSHWLPWGLQGQDLLRWLLFAEGAEPTVDEEVVLWVADTGN